MLRNLRHSWPASASDHSESISESEFDASECSFSDGADGEGEVSYNCGREDIDFWSYTDCQLIVCQPTNYVLNNTSRSSTSQ